MKHVGLKHILFSVFLLAAFSVSVHAQAMQVDSISTDPTIIAPGQTFTLYAYLTNSTSTPARDVQAILDLGQDTTDTSFPFSIEPTDSLVRALGTVPGFSTVQVKYQIRVDPSALDGSYSIVLRATDFTGSGGTLTFPIEIASRQPILTIIQATPSLVKSGETVSMEITLKNTGSSPAYDIRVALKEDRTVTSTGVVVNRTILPLGAASAYTAQLGAGEIAIVHIPILITPSAESKPTFVPVTLDYTDSSKVEYTSTDYIGLKVSSEPALDAIISNSTPVLVPGKKSKLSIDLFNQGLGPAKFVTAAISADFLDAPQKEFFIGTIESDDFDTVILDATVSSSISQGEHPITIQVMAKNEYGDPISFTKTLNANVYASAPSTNGNDSSLPFLFIIAVIVILVWWFRFRKQPSKNGNGNGKK